MITAHKKNQFKQIPGSIKFDIALHAIRKQQTVTGTSKYFNCSRTTVYKQKDKALNAANCQSASKINPLLASKIDPYTVLFNY